MNDTFNLTNNTLTVPLDASVMQITNNTVENKAIKISSTADVSVHLITYPTDTHEDVLVLPTECISTRYTVSSYQSNKKYPSYKGNFLVIATQDNTSVDISVRLNNRLISNFTIGMDRMQSYLYNNVNDITGTILTSDKPIAVFSGHEAIVFTRGEYVSEQQIPTELYGSSFIVPTLNPKSRYFIRIISSESNTLVTYREAADTVNKTKLFTDGGEFLEVIASEPLYVEADKPVTVMMYSFDVKDQGDTIGAPFLSIVPATTHYMSEYIITVPDAFASFNNYLSIIALSDSIDDIKLDGRDLPHCMSSFNLTVNGQDYLVNTYTVGQGFHRLENQNKANFGAMIYGYVRDSGYGTSLGLQFSNASYTSPSPVGVTPVLNFTQRCYACRDMSHLYLCDTVTQCNEHQTCYVEQYRTVGGDVRFNSGCTETEKCTNVTTTSECMQCCNGDYCNGKGCNGQELPPRNVRGPLCFDCQHVTNMSECHTLRLCSPDQVCGVERYTWGGLYNHYTAKCHSQHCLSRRSVPDCLQCCKDDFCNTECKEANTDPAFIG